MSLDTYLVKSGIVWADVISSLERYISYKFLDNEQILTRKYTIPINDTYEYVYIDLSSMKNTAIMNAMPVKADSANLDFTNAIAYDGTGDTDIEKFVFAYHGKGIILETNTEELTEGPLIVAIKTLSKAIDGNVNKDLEDALKQCYGYLYNNDIDLFYIALKCR